jgi:hypothetical protein
MAPLVAVVNESMARFYYGSAAAIGRTFELNGTSVSIVGVVADTKDHRLDVPPARRFYVPYFQGPPGDADALRFEVRTSGDPALVARAAHDAILAVDPAMPAGDIFPLSVLMRESVRQERLLTRVATGFGVLALLLAALGLYGVMTYAVTRRTNEIGLRLALGAQRQRVITLVMADSLRLVAMGVAIGVPLAFASTRLLRTQLHGVAPTDLAALLVAIGVLTASAVVAALVPALRAARIAPLAALREE